MGVLSKGCMRQRRWKTEEALLEKSWKYDNIRDLHLLVTLQAAVYTGMRGLVPVQGARSLLGQAK